MNSVQVYGKLTIETRQSTLKLWYTLVGWIFDYLDVVCCIVCDKKIVFLRKV